MVRQVVTKTTTERPSEATHWTARAMARAVGIAASSVQKIWRDHGLKPHLVRTFKLSNDPRFEEKLVDVVSLYLNPPDKALVLSVDEKSQIQALDRTPPGLPLKKGRAGTMTHDYKRHGTTTLFAALNVLDGSVIGRCMPRHRHQELILSAKSPARPRARIAAGNRAGVITWNRPSPAKCPRATQPQRTWPGLLWRLPDFADSIRSSSASCAPSMPGPRPGWTCI